MIALFTFSSDLLERDKFLVFDYLAQRYDSFNERMAKCIEIDRHPLISYSILKSTVLANSVKIDLLLKEFFGQYFCGVCIGKTGSGKTAFFYWVAERMHEYDPTMNIFLVGFPVIKGIPDYFKYADPSEIESLPQNSLILVDEVALIFNTKSWNDKDITKLNNLLRLKRQQRKRYLFGSQVASDVSIEMARRMDFLIIKRISLAMADTDGRAEIYEPYRPFFVEKVDQLLFISDSADKRMILSTGLASFWTNEISCAFGNAASYGSVDPKFTQKPVARVVDDDDDFIIITPDGSRVNVVGKLRRDVDYVILRS